MNLAYVTYGALELLSADMTLLPGRHPSVCISTAIATNYFHAVDSLKFVYANEVRAFFPGAAIDIHSLKVHKGFNGGFFYDLRILDRRWVWRYFDITAEYNRRLPNGELDIEYDLDGNPITLIHVRSARELGTMLLKHMGEVNFYVDDLPDDSYPHVLWDRTNAGLALEELCDLYGCRICLGADNIVRICSPVGTMLNPDSPAIADYLWAMRGDLPRSIRVVGAPTIVQHHYWCTAMGLDNDGTFRQTDQLTYEPSQAGPAENPLPWYHLGPQDRGLAQHTYKRYWRPYKLADGSGGTTWSKVLGPHGDVFWKNVHQMLPLLPHLVDMEPTLMTTEEGESHEAEVKSYYDASPPGFVRLLIEGGTDRLLTETGTQLIGEELAS